MGEDDIKDGLVTKKGGKSYSYSTVALINFAK